MRALRTRRGLHRCRVTLPRRRWFHGLALAGLLALAGADPAVAVLVDAVLAQVGSGIVTASDVALARALGLFGFTPSQNPIDAADVDRYSTAFAEVLEASRLGLEPSPSEIDAAWTALEERRGGPAAFRAWLDAVAIDPAWARRAFEAHLRWRAWAEFHAGFSEPGLSGTEGESSTAKPALRSDVVVHRLLKPSETVPVPFPLPR